MRYADLFTLNPIETVVKINAADKKSEAKRLVSTFVITESLAQQIQDVAIPQLDLDGAVEGKGIFVVGNYGTGKSHVMSFLSVLAEDAGYLEYVRDSEWREKLRPVAGRYRVRRCQIAASLMTLYHIVADNLVTLAKNCGFDFQFKAQHQVANIKDEFERYMQAFDAACPGMGVLLVVDELLHYMETRNDQDLAIDLSVLQSLGEFCDGTRFAFMAGLQQSLFNNPRFNHMASSINRIRQRYYDFVIDSKGVAQLVEQYLFEKTDAQRQQIRDLLSAHFDLYEVLGERIEEFVSLFPAHPGFIEEFQRVFVVERREILTVLSRQAKKWLDQEVSKDAPDLITSDDYWPYIEADQGLRANADIVKVAQNVATIRARIESDFAPNEDKDSAIRLIYALAVNRLTTPSITDAVGLTPKDLKNELIWHTPTPMRDPVFLTGAAKRLLDRTREAVNGQFLAVSDATGQYYIDPTRIRDYDQEVETYAKVSLPKDVTQRYLNELFTRAVELDNEEPVIASRLWEYNTLTWTAKNVARPGWLFFGFPNQRSTAQPPKDFYLFIIPSQRITGLTETWVDAADESYWLIEDFSEEFLEKLELYASARELASRGRRGSDEQMSFERIAKTHLEPALRSFVDKAGDWITVEWNGQRKRFLDWVRDLAPGKENSLFKTKLEAISEVMFASHFDAKYPNYPTFGIKINETTRPQNAQFALEIVCGHGMQTEAGKKVLAALGLYKDDTPTPNDSPWLEAVRKQLRMLDPGQVLNNSDLFEKREGRVWMKGESIEAEWLHVVLAAGIEAGDLVVYGPNNAKYDAASLPDFYRQVKAWDQIIRVGVPAGVPIAQWRKLLGMFKVNQGLLATPATYQNALEDFQTALSARVLELVANRQKLLNPLPFSPEDGEPCAFCDTAAFDQSKEILESLSPLNSRAKMQNLKLTDAEIDGLSDLLKQCATQERIIQFMEDEQAKLSALQRYEDILAGQSAFITALDAFKQAVKGVYAAPATADLNSLSADLDSTIRLALKAYQDLKKRHTLDRDGDTRKKAILAGPTLKSLNKLALISVLKQSRLEDLRVKLSNLPVDQACTDDELLKSPTSLCPYTKFDPRTLQPDTPPAADLLAECEQEVDKLLGDWTTQLLNDLGDPAIQAALSALKPSDRQIVDRFVQSQKLPATVDDAFIRIMNEALSGLKTRPIKAVDLTKALMGDGVPLKESELRERFEKWLRNALANDAPEAVRFVLED